MDINDEALSTIISGIIKTINKSINNAKFNKGVTGRIISSLGNNEYQVKINGQLYTAKSRLTFNNGDVVKIIKWNNNINELYIVY